MGFSRSQQVVIFHNRRMRGIVGDRPRQSGAASQEAGTVALR
jgi:hypothetical protein